MDVEKRFAQHLIAAVSFIILLAVSIGCLLANASLPVFTRIIVTPTVTPNPWGAGEIAIVGDFVLIQPFTVQGRGFKSGDSVDILLSNTSDAPPDRWTVIGEALGTNRVGPDGTFSINNVRIPSTLNPPYFVRARASSDKRLTCSVLQIDKTMISGGVTGRSCDNLPAAATSTPMPSQPTPTALALVTTTPMPSPTITPLPPTPVPTGAAGYWFGRFYANKDFVGNVVYDMPAAKDLAFSWGTGSPSASVPTDNFSAIWERSEVFTESDQYEFTIRVDDGMRLYLDNTLITPQIEFRSGPLRTIQVSQFVNAGPHTLRVEYMEETQNATIEVSWRKLNASVGAFQGKYYNGLQHANAIIYKSIDSQINMDWSLALPPVGVSPDGFSVKWDGTINITRTGRYLFNVAADSGVAILINNTSIINELNNTEGMVERTIEVPITVAGNYN
nr:PA14 domain-containing protein [Anaerolineae bacterium]